MKIGYPCINLTLDCRSSRTFRLASYSEEMLIETVNINLECLRKILQWNADHSILFFRISSDLIPFASHYVNIFDWQNHFASKFKALGLLIKKYEMRVTMHPDQFVVINSPTQTVVNNSVRELIYHTQILDLLDLDSSHKVQIHLGGGYGDKKSAKSRFVQEYKKLPESVQARLVVENDDRIYSVADCLSVNRKIGIPVVLDTFHHQLNNNGETLAQIFEKVKHSWQRSDGTPMIDYSTQAEGQRVGTHTQSINIGDFDLVTGQLIGDFDVMLEIKDKEKSVLQVLNANNANITKDR